MKSKITIVLDNIMSWVNRSEVKKYKLMMQDNNNLISQAQHIINKQEEIVNKGRIIKSDNVTYFTLQKNVDYENAVNVKANLEILKADINAINGYYNDLIKAHSQMSGSKQEIITVANNKILNAKNNMLKVTGGLSPEEYIFKYRPKEQQ